MQLSVGPRSKSLKHSIDTNEVTGHDFLFPEFVVAFKEEEEWLGASPDGDIHVVKDGLCPFYDDGDKKYRLIHGRRFLGIMFQLPQAQGLMEIMDRRDWLDFLYCWTVNGSSLFRFHRDSVFWDDIK